MKMKAMAIGDVTYGQITTDEQFITQVQPQISTFDLSVTSGSDDITEYAHGELVLEFLKTLSLAHECIPEFDQKKQSYTYRGSSPDEVTLVDAAQDLGFINTAHSDKLSIVDINGDQVEYQVYRRIDFTSDRKRMSILIRDPKSGIIKLYVKGADNVI